MKRKIIALILLLSLALTGCKKPDGGNTPGGGNPGDNVNPGGNPGENITTDSLPCFGDLGLKELIEKYIPYFDEIERFCKEMQVPPTVTDRDKILAGINRALVMRDRYTILFYLRDHGLLERYAEQATEQLLQAISSPSGK